MSIPSAPGTTIACALLLALSCTACTRPPPAPPEQPPEPQAQAEVRETIPAPIDRAEASRDAAAKQSGAIDAAVAG